MEEAFDELVFSPDQTEALAFEIIWSALDRKTYEDHPVQGWIDEIRSRTTKDLVDMNKPYKAIRRISINARGGGKMSISG